MDPTTAVRTLLDGHARFITARTVHAHRSRARQIEIAAEPRPFAAILGCADARVPPEILFDQGLGDLFVVRVAGSALVDATLGSIEVAVRDVAVPFVLVLGHSRCRAMQLTLDALHGSGGTDDHTGALVDALRPAAERAGGRAGDCLEAAIRANVESVVGRLRVSEPLLAPAVRAGTLEIAGWLFDVDSGTVEVIA